MMEIMIGLLMVSVASFFVSCIFRASRDLWPIAVAFKWRDVDWAFVKALYGIRAKRPHIISEVLPPVNYLVRREPWRIHGVSFIDSVSGRGGVFAVTRRFCWRALRH
jgi:hypothetical protein